MKEINVDELRRRLEAGEDLVVLDVREPDEVARTSEDSEMVCRKYSSGRRFDMRSCYAVTPHPSRRPTKSR